MIGNNPPTIVIDENHLSGVTHVSPRRNGRPPTYGRLSLGRSRSRSGSRSPRKSMTPTSTRSARRASPSPENKTCGTSPKFSATSPSSTTDTALRNITAESKNVYHSSSAPTTPQGGFLPLKSPGQLQHYAGDEKLVTRLYGQIETQEGEFNRLSNQYSEEQKRYNQEKQRRESLEQELADAKKEIEEAKKRFIQHKKQERELRNKAELDLKERQREEGNRWDTTLEEIAHLRRELTAKSKKLAEFEFMCMNLQQTLDNEKIRAQEYIAEADKRVAMSSQMLETAHGQLSMADKQLKKEKKMKQILIKINEALQKEVRRSQDQLAKAAVSLEKQGETLPLPSTMSMKFSKSGESAEMYTSAIIEDLQIEDALFYFEEVKRQYEDRPKVYRVFLEIIRDYKGRKVSTPDVIERIAKLFQGNKKLIIGFNRFLPKDYHITEETLVEMESFNDDNMPERYQVKQETNAKQQTEKPIVVGVDVPTIKGNEVATGDNTHVQKGDATNAQKQLAVNVNVPKAESNSGAVSMENKDKYHKKGEAATKTENQNDQDKQTAVKGKTKKKKDEKSLARSSKTSKRRKKKSSKAPNNHTALADSSVSSQSEKHSFLLTISTSSSLDESAAKPPVKKMPPDLSDDDEEDGEEEAVEEEDTTATGPAPRSDGTSDNATACSDAISPTSADIGESPGLDLRMLSSVASSHVFGGIESDGPSFGVGIFSVDQSTLYMPSDRYEVVEDSDEYTAIELVAEGDILGNSLTSESDFYRRPKLKSRPCSGPELYERY